MANFQRTIYAKPHCRLQVDYIYIDNDAEGSKSGLSPSIICRSMAVSSINGEANVSLRAASFAPLASFTTYFGGCGRFFGLGLMLSTHDNRLCGSLAEVIGKSGMISPLHNQWMSLAHGLLTRVS